MKNKKLFAILTLVCFMFTLMPVAAFAAADGYVNMAVVGEETTTYSDKETVTVSPDEVNFVVSASADAAGTAEDYVFYVVDEDGKGVDVTTTGAIVFDTVGDYKVYAVEANGDLIDLATDYKMFADDKVTLIKANFKNAIVKHYAEVKVKSAKASYAIELDLDAPAEDSVAAENGYEYVYSCTANNGFKAVEIEATVSLADADGNAIAGKEVEGAKLSYSTNSGYITVNAIDAETDKDGVAKFSIAATKAGNYKVTVKYEKAFVDIYVTVGSTEVANVVKVSDAYAPVALDSSLAASTIFFKLTDGNGNVIKGENQVPLAVTYPLNAAAVDVTVVEEPADSNLADETLGLIWLDKAQAWTLMGGDFEEEGKYTFKVALENGVSAQGSVTIKEFDEPVKMTLAYKQNTIDFAGVAEIDAIKLVDANGVTKDITNDLDEYNVEFAANGLAVDSVGEDGTITAKGAAAAQGLDLIGSTITVMAVYDDLYATAELKVVKSAVSLKYAKTTADIAVNNTLVVNTVDVDGNIVDIAGLSAETTEVTVYVLDAPENAKYAVSGAATDVNNKVNVTFTASAAGEYKLQTVVKYVAGESTKYISSIDTITVGGTTNEFKDVVVVSLGADKMIVNNEVVALDVAPFIENNRTMMQYNVLYVFGIDVQWDGVNSVIAEGDGIKVVMTIGSKVAVVNGEEVALDVAPYVVNGRTVVPVGFITGVLDITPVFTYNADGSIADILFAK